MAQNKTAFECMFSMRFSCSVGVMVRFRPHSNRLLFGGLCCWVFLAIFVSAGIVVDLYLEWYSDDRMSISMSRIDRVITYEFVVCRVALCILFVLVIYSVLIPINRSLTFWSPTASLSSFGHRHIAQQCSSQSHHRDLLNRGTTNTLWL